MLLLDPEAQGQFQYTVQIFLLPSYRSRLPSVPEKASPRPHELMSAVASGAITMELNTLADISSSLSPFLWNLPLQCSCYGSEVVELRRWMLELTNRALHSEL